MSLSVCVCGYSQQEGLSVFLSCTAAGVFVHCWSGLLSPICRLLISMETGPGAFSHIHTLAINQQVRPGSIPTHTHHTHENKEHTHTDTVASHRKHPGAHFSSSRPHLSSQRIRPGNPNFFVHQIWRPIVTSQLAFRFKWWLFPRGTLSEHKETCSHQLFSFFLSSWDELASTIVWICYLICLATMNGHIETESVFPWTDYLV